MKKGRWSVEKIISILKETDTGVSIAEPHILDMIDYTRKDVCLSDAEADIITLKQRGLDRIRVRAEEELRSIQADNALLSRKLTCALMGIAVDSTSFQVFWN